MATAVELVEKLLARHNHHSRDHFQRRTALERHHPNRQLNRAYGSLYYASLDARYSPLAECPTAKEAREDLIGKRLRFIIQYVAAHT